MGLLVTPNPDDPLVVSIAETYQNNRYLHKSLSCALWRGVWFGWLVIQVEMWRICVSGGGRRLDWGDLALGCCVLADSRKLFEKTAKEYVKKFAM
jgi:hypothetical protein